MKLAQKSYNRGAAQRRSNRRPRRRNGGDSVGRYFGDAWSLAKRTAHGLNEIRKLINVEQKFKEQSATAQTYDSSGYVDYLSGTDQGDSTITREGNSIKIQHVRLRLFIKHNSAVTEGITSRVLIVRDLQNAGATITANDVLENVGNARAPLAFRDFVNGPLQNKRFAIVYDQVFTTDPYHPIEKDVFETAHDCHVYYRGTSSSVASAGNGSYFLIAVSDIAANLPNITYNVRFEFTDN